MSRKGREVDRVNGLAKGKWHRDLAFEYVSEGCISIDAPAHMFWEDFYAGLIPIARQNVGWIEICDAGLIEPLGGL